MPFTQNSNFNNNNAPQGEKKKTNFPVGKVYGTDAILNLSIWISDSAVYTIFAIKQAIGKDPSTGANAFEQKAPNELPRVFMNPEYLCAFREAAKLGNDINISPKRGTTIRVTGINTNQIKITIDTEKQGSRTITFDSIPTGSSNVQASWINMTKLLEVAYKKALFAKLDPEAFAVAFDAEGSAEELPI
jgi:hypothetical protein